MSRFLRDSRVGSPIVTGSASLARIARSQNVSPADTDPDVVVLDVHLGNGSRPADNVRALKEAGTAVLIVSGDEEPMTVIGAIEAGADGYLRKGDDLATLTESLREAVAGNQPVSPVLAFILSRDARPDRPQLTHRESQVLEYFGSGLPWERVAQRLDMKHSTVKVHLRNIRAKYSNR